MPTIRHPAKYSDALLPILAEELSGYQRVLDPFAGTGKLRDIRPDAYLLEIEPEWAALRGATVGDATCMPWPDCFFDAVCTSVTYGNRMADHHNARDGSRRNTYKHALGRDLAGNNTGQFQWGRVYRDLHYRAYREIWRILEPGGVFILNVSDHIRKGEIVRVSRFHKLLCLLMGFDLVRTRQIATPRLRYGQNHEKRVEHENIFVFKKPD